MRLNLILAPLILGFSLSAAARELTVSCTGSKGKSVKLHVTLQNVNTPPEIKTLKINEVTQNKVRDYSKMPVYKDGNITFEIAFGASHHSRVNLSLTKCQDDFEATGTGTLREYVGGFVGSLPTQLNCSCDLKQ